MTRSFLVFKTYNAYVILYVESEPLAIRNHDKKRHLLYSTSVFIGYK